MIGSILRQIAAGPAPKPPPGMGHGGGLADAAAAGGQGGAPTSVTTALVVVKFMSARLGAMPRKVVERGDELRRPVTSDEFRPLWGAPRRGRPAVPMWSTAFAHLEGWADVFFWRRRVPGRRVPDLELIHPGRVSVSLDSRNDPEYRLDGRDKPVYGPDQIVHVPGMNWDGVRGIPPVKAATAAHAVAHLQERWQRSFLSRGSSPSGVVSTPAELDEEAVDEFYEAWDEMFSGAGSAGRVVLLQGQAAYSPVTISPVDAQLLQSRAFSREEVVGLYAPGVPHHLLGFKSNTSNFGTGIEQQGIHLVQHVFAPRLALMSDALSSALLPDDLELAWDTAMWVEGDSKAQAEVWSKMRLGGAATRDEWRRAAGLGDLPIPDTILVPLNTTAIDADTGESADPPEQPSGAEPGIRR